MVRKIHRTADTRPEDVAELKRLMFKRIAELEAAKPAEAASTDTIPPEQRAA
jgi:hypothetical protein